MAFSLLTNLLFVCALAQGYQWKTLSYKQPVDHFGFANQDSYQQRYLLNTTYWKKNGGPIFFYTGNEGDIEWFAQNTGFMWDIAPDFGAMLLFGEHRYYGNSMPYGNKSYSSPTYLGYLTSEQALADFAELVSYVKSSTPGAQDSPVIAFGGSYGGMLAAWMRIKYPHIITGSIAASAPILQFTGLTPCDAFNRVVTADFAAASTECANTIRRSWKALDQVLSTDEGKAWLQKEWNLCTQLPANVSAEPIKEYLADVWTNLAMVDYPYAANFLAPLPAFPIKAVCEKMTNSSLEDRPLLQQVFRGLSVYANFSGQSECLDPDDGADQALGARGWDFQACTEMVMPMCSDGVSDMFQAEPWNLDKYSERCFKKWKVRPRALMAAQMYGGRNITASSNIVFSNGLLDPWSTGGVTKTLSDSIVALIIPDGAHHLDLRGQHPDDPPSVVKARVIERQFIAKWLSNKGGKATKKPIFVL